MKSGLYFGTVYHRRARPKAHSLRYRVFSLLVDLDEIPSLSKRLWLLRFGGPGVLSFNESDHGDGGEAPLRQWVTDKVARSGIDISGGSIRILTYPRMFGYVFNPLSVFFCYGSDDRLAAILYEVSNTYGERHAYTIPVGADAAAPRQTAAKVMYVSPFLPDEGRYRFNISPPGDDIGVTIRFDDSDGPLLTASFAGRRRELTDWTLALALIRYPLMTVKVIAGIHWEAFKLWRKGIPFRPHRPTTGTPDRSKPALNEPLADRR